MSTSRRSTLPAAALAAVLLAAGCGGEDPSGSPPAAAASETASSAADDADTMFAQMMIPHHEEAVEMASLATSRAADPEVKQVAAKIAAAQQAEIGTLQGWLTAWGAEQQADGMGHDMDMPGAMTDEDLAKLESAGGAEFDTLWVPMMVQHHEGAISMAEDAVAEGADPAVKAFAQKVIADQQAEIATLEKIGARL